MKGNILKLLKLNAQMIRKYSNKTMRNSLWLIFERLFTLTLGVFVTALLARYFGPEKFGYFHQALAFVTLFTSISTLGLETITVNELNKRKYNEEVILGTSFVLRFFGGISGGILAYLAVKTIESDVPLISVLVLIMSFSMIFKSLEIIEYWTHYLQSSKSVSVIKMKNYVISSLLKLALVLLGGDLKILALIHMLESLILAIGLINVYLKNNESKKRWMFDLVYAKDALSQSWYLILSGLMITAYMQIDKIMLSTMLLDKSEVGIYSAANQIASMWFFVPIAIITSFKTLIFRYKNTDSIKYIDSVQTLYSLITFIGIFFGIVITVVANYLITFLYGPVYSGASSILVTLVWSGLFATLGMARSVWLLAENLQKFTLIYTLAGLICNLSFNFYLIPLYKGDGAALASLISQFFANIIVLAFFKSTRLSSLMILKSFSPSDFIRRFKSYVVERRLK